MGRSPKRPKVVRVGPARASAIRGPHRDGSGRWYWQGVVFDGVERVRRTLWSGWAHRAEVEVALAQLVATGADLTEAPPASAIETVQDLLEVWVSHVERVGGRRGPLKPSSVRIYRYAARHLVAVIGTVRVDRLTRPTVEQHRDTRLAQGAATRDRKHQGHRRFIQPLHSPLNLPVRVAWTPRPAPNFTAAESRIPDSRRHPARQTHLTVPVAQLTALQAPALGRRESAPLGPRCRIP